MGRTNKMIEGVFTDIVGSSTEISKPNVFIDFGKTISKDKALTNLTKVYTQRFESIKSKIEELAVLEVLILQMRAKLNISDVKLSTVREYIYARCPFYRNDKSTKDIRVIVGNTEFHGTDLNNLIGNKEFMENAKLRLERAMEYEIQENLHKLKIIDKSITI